MSGFFQGFAAGCGGGSYGKVTAGGGGAALRFSTNQQTPMAKAMTRIAATFFAARSCAGGTDGAGLGIHQIADALGHLEVEFGEAALAVGREDDAHFRVADVNVRVVVRLLGKFRDAVHEINRAGEVVELERAFDAVFFEIPFGRSLRAALICLESRSCDMAGVMWCGK